MQIQEQYSKNNHVINSEWGREGIFMSFSLIRTLHLHSEESGWIPRSSGSWLSDLRLCNLLICLNFCFHICKMGMIVPSLSTSQGLLGNPREKQPLFIKKKKKKGEKLVLPRHLPYARHCVVLTRGLWGRSHYWPICRCGAFSSERLFNLSKCTELEE